MPEVSYNKLWLLCLVPISTTWFASDVGYKMAKMNRVIIGKQATGLGAWASRVKCPARFVSHLHEICTYELFIACYVAICDRRNL